MPYPNFYPQQQFYPNQQQTYFQSQPQMQMPQQQTPQTNGLIGIPSEADARNYPVALGNSVTFKDESAPYIYTKTMGFSQLEPPRFEKYRLIKEDAETVEPEKKVDYAEKAELEAVKTELKTVKADLAKLKKVKREVIIEDDDE